MDFSKVSGGYNIEFGALIHMLGRNEASILSKLVLLNDFFDEHEYNKKKGCVPMEISTMYGHTGIKAAAQRTAISNLEKGGFIEQVLMGMPSKRYFRVLANEKMLKGVVDKGFRKMIEINEYFEKFNREEKISPPEHQFFLGDC